MLGTVNYVIKKNNDTRRLLTLFTYEYKKYCYFLVKNVNNRRQWGILVKIINKIDFQGGM